MPSPKTSVLIWHLDSTLGLVLLLSFAAGAVMAVLLTLPGAWRRSRSNSRQRREVDEVRALLAESERQLAVLKSASDPSSKGGGSRRTDSADPGANLLGLPPLVDVKKKR